ncbi:DUF4278 domain-containing protein [Anabaena subtropica]|uniref:DUF4278 domain-containing protein n=1 Tax=Anabaena subtropica FACHB-260 TaxID=2692884 RepID=A0ABR8CUW9_9NOST|nr:DUF4278 domain-containing protein [Anabaena subtropica]MBD2346986.1 DUF4278 domain-containing protein [Anabaena subtropica FACHB-260]
MLLSYRGSYYETYDTITAKLPQKQNFTTVKYRGVSYKIVKPTTAKNQHPIQLKYRGVTYMSMV